MLDRGVLRSAPPWAVLAAGFAVQCSHRSWWAFVCIAAVNARRRKCGRADAAAYLYV